MDLTTVYCILDDFYCNFSLDTPHDLLLGPRHLRQRCTSLSLIETVHDQLKNVCQIEHSRHRSPINAFVHRIAGLVGFTWQEKRPALSWTREEQEILNAHKQLVCV